MFSEKITGLLEIMIKKNINKIIAIIAMAGIVFMILPILISSAYTIFAADDFNHANHIALYRVDFFEYLNRSFEYSFLYWKHWQGTYFSMFIQALLSPLNNFGLSQLRCVMVLSSILFWLSFLYFLYVILRKIGCKTHVLLCIIALITFSLTGYMAYEEIYYWFSGATSYSIPVSMLFIGLAAFLNYVDSYKRKHLISALIFGFLAMGGSLTVTGMGMYILLLMCVFYCLEEKRINTKYVFVFLIWLSGAIINAFAKGNFFRHGIIDETGIHPFKAIYYSLKNCYARYLFFSGNTNYIVILVLFIICGLFIYKETMNLKFYTLVSVFGLLTPFVSTYPLALANSGSGLPNRCEFVFDLALILVLANIFCLIGCYFSCWCKNRNKSIRFALCLLCFVALLFSPICNYGLKDNKTYQITKQLCDGSYADYYNECANLYASLEERADGEQVQIPLSEFPNAECVENTYPFYLSDDSSDWINEAVAQYFHLSGISISEE